MATTTLAYSTTGDYWKTRYSFAPSCYGYIDNRLISCNINAGSQAWLHSSTTQKCNFYGGSFPLTITFASNENPSANKFFKNISVEGDYDDWNCTLSTYSDSNVQAERQLTFISGASFSRREGTSHTDIPRSAQNSTNNIKYVGRRADDQSLVEDYNVLLDNIIDPAPDPGSSVVVAYDNGTLMCIVDKEVVSYSGQSNAVKIGSDYSPLNDGPRLYISNPPDVQPYVMMNILRTDPIFEYMYALTPAEIDGDFMRGKACTITMEAPSVPNGLELYAVNVDFEYSELDSRLG